MLDVKAFSLFFKDFFEPLYGFALKYTEDDDSARDIAQETFIKLYERWADFESEDKAKSFAYTTARNKSLDYLKHKKVEQEYSRYLEPAIEESLFLEEVTYQETIRRVHAAIQQLPPQCRKIILLSFTGKNNAEIGEEMAISVNTVKTQKKIAYKILRNLLGKQYLALLMVYFAMEHWKAPGSIG